MEFASSIVLEEGVMESLSPSQQVIFTFEWLRFLDKVLVAVQKSQIRDNQKKLLEQLVAVVSRRPGPPSRKLVGRVLATVFHVGDTYELFDCVNRMNDLLKSREEMPSQNRLAALSVLGGLYERLGRMVGRSFEDTVAILRTNMKSADSQMRTDILSTLAKLVDGLGSGGSSCHRDVYRIGRPSLADRSLLVRRAAARCLTALAAQPAFQLGSDFDSVVTSCCRAFDGANYETRTAVAELLSVVLSSGLQNSMKMQSQLANAEKGGTMAAASLAAVQSYAAKSQRNISIDYVFNMLESAFLRGGGGFKSTTAGEMIKGPATASKEVRVGVTHAYLEFLKRMGPSWLEQNSALVCRRLLKLSKSPRASHNHVSAVYSRQCICFVLQRAISTMLSEQSQIGVAKELCAVIVDEMNRVSGTDLAQGSCDELDSSQHVLVCALQTVAFLAIRLFTSTLALVEDDVVDRKNLIDVLFSVLIHPTAAVRLTGAWAVRCVATVLPGQLAPMIERSLEQLNKLKANADARDGYSAAVAALLGVVQSSELGIPKTHSGRVFSSAKDLLKDEVRAESGWLMIGAVLSMGSPMAQTHLPRLLVLWRNSFPRSVNELDQELEKGNEAKWRGQLVNRAGALASIKSFLIYCPELLNDAAIQRLKPTIECAVTMAANLEPVLKVSDKLKVHAFLLRLRLYDCLLHLSPRVYDTVYNLILREVVAEFTLATNPANWTTGLLRSMCHEDDNIILGSWTQETDYQMIEAQLQPNSFAGSGSIEHDPHCLYGRCKSPAVMASSDSQFIAGELDLSVPDPLPLGVSVIDSSVRLFGHIFPFVPSKHRLQMFDHFLQCIKQTKPPRQQAVQLNVFTAVLCTLKNLAESKGDLGSADVRQSAGQLVLGALSNADPVLRCAAGEALGRMAQVVKESRFLAETAVSMFERLKAARDLVTRTGHSLSLGCLHRYVGSVASFQHLGSSVSVLLALAQDSASPDVQAWSLHALALIADSGGPMFRSYVESALQLLLVLDQLLTCPHSITVHQCLGKCLFSLITTIGPELKSTTARMSNVRSQALICCAALQEHPDALVQVEAINCLQSMHMFAPLHVNLSTLVPHLIQSIRSDCLLLRRAAVICLRQLTQREAHEVSELVMQLFADDSVSSSFQTLALRSDRCVLGPEFGLSGVLFQLIDQEQDARLLLSAKDCMVSLLQSTGTKQLAKWIQLIKQVLAAAAAVSAQPDVAVSLPNNDDDDDEDDVEGFAEAVSRNQSSSSSSRWSTRVFACQCLRRLMSLCHAEKDTDHFDLTTARAVRESQGRGEYLVFYLSDLIRMSFIASTAEADPLRLAGLGCLQQVIELFANVPEPEFAGHLLLEQYQAQISTALGPAFSPDTAPDITALACQVSSRWIGSGVAKDLNDLRRVHQLLVRSLSKLKQGQSQLASKFSESSCTMEKLAVLKAWADVYIEAIRQMHGRNEERREHKRRRQSSCRSTGIPLSCSDDDRFKGWDDGFLDYDEQAGASHLNADESIDLETATPTENLLSLVQPELLQLSRMWRSAVQDYALLQLPAEFERQLPAVGGAFYSSDALEASRTIYRQSWASLLYALVLWYNETDFMSMSRGTKRSTSSSRDSEPSSMAAAAAAIVAAADTADDDDDQADGLSCFHLLVGICVQYLCQPASVLNETVSLTCLRSLDSLFSHPWPRQQIINAVEPKPEESTSPMGSNDPQSTDKTESGLAEQLALAPSSQAERLCVELLNVMHRVVLTRNSVALHTVALSVSSHVVHAVESAMDAGGQSAERFRSMSVAFAALEISVCVLVGYVSGLKEQVKSAQLRTMPLKPIWPTDAQRLLSSSIRLMLSALATCRPDRSRAAMFPVVCHVMVQIFWQICAAVGLDHGRPKSSTTTSSLPPAVSPLTLLNVYVASWHDIFLIFDNTQQQAEQSSERRADRDEPTETRNGQCPHTENHQTEPDQTEPDQAEADQAEVEPDETNSENRCQSEWTESLAESFSAVLRPIAGLVDSGAVVESAVQYDGTLRVCLVFLRHCPRRVLVACGHLLAPDGIVSRLMEWLWRQPDLSHRIACLNGLLELVRFGDVELCAAPLQKLGPAVICQLLQMVQTGRVSNTPVLVLAKLSADFCVELLQRVGTGSASNPDQQLRRADLLAVVLPVLVATADSDGDGTAAASGSSSRLRLQLASHVCAKLINVVVPAWQSQVRDILSSSAVLKERLQRAIRAHQSREAGSKGGTGAKPTERLPTGHAGPASTAAPKIKLTMDFAKFASQPPAAPHHHSHDDHDDHDDHDGHDAHDQTSS